jgi:hypothetical protein
VRSLCDTIRKTGLLVHGLGDGDVNVLSFLKVCADFLACFTLRDFDVVLGGAFVGHQAKESVLDVDLTHALTNVSKRVDPTNWYSVRATLGTSMLCVEGQRSSYFF